MLNNKTTIFIFSPSEIIYKGLYVIILELGLDAIHIANIDEFNGYTKTDGSILIILPTHWHKEFGSHIESNLFHSATIKFIDYSYNLTSDENLYIEDSTSEIIDKLQLKISAFSNQTSHNIIQELTSREIDVLKLIALGYTIKEIANELFISSHTAISHRKNISEKTGIKTISGLTMYAVIKEIIEIKDINTDNLK